MDEKDPSDLEDVIREERSRGRRPIDTEAQRKRRERLKMCRELLQYSSEREVREVIFAYGLEDGSPEFLEVIRVWRAWRGSYRPRG